MDNNNNKTLNKDNFNNMSIQEQIQIINQFIKLGDSINNIAKMLGYNETTLRDRYKRAGYARVSKRGIFVPVEELESHRAEEQATRETTGETSNKKDNKNKTTRQDKGAKKKMKTDNKSTNSNNIQGQENLLNTIELGDNIFKLLPAEQGTFSTALELNNAVKRNINIRTNKELSRRLLTIYNFLTSVEPEAGDAINYTSIITGALDIYFEQLQAEYGDLFNSYVISSEPETANTSHHKAVNDLFKRINGK